MKKIRSLIIIISVIILNIIVYYSLFHYCNIKLCSPPSEVSNLIDEINENYKDSFYCKYEPCKSATAANLYYKRGEISDSLIKAFQLEIIDRTDINFLNVFDFNNFFFFFGTRIDSTNKMIKTGYHY